MRHELKMLPEFFQIAWVGDKPFEIRKNDRNFQERDEIILQELAQDRSGDHEYSGREIEGIIDYVTDYNQKPGYVVFSYTEKFRREE